VAVNDDGHRVVLSLDVVLALDGESATVAAGLRAATERLD
jgi:hypothetical protein